MASGSQQFELFDVVQGAGGTSIRPREVAAVGQAVRAGLARVEYPQNVLPPAARASDPESSHKAAARVTKRGTRAIHCMQVLRLVVEHPGQSSAELAAVALAAGLSSLNRHECARRLSDLEDKGWVIGAATGRKCTVCGSVCLLWNVTPSGAEVVCES